MAKNLTKKEKGFADDYLETGNGTKSALKNYNTDDENIAGSIASQNLRKLKIRQYLEEKSEIVKNTIFELSQEAKNETVRLNACKDIMDRGGFKPVEQSEVKVTLPKPLMDLSNNGICDNNSNKEDCEIE